MPRGNDYPDTVRSADDLLKYLDVAEKLSDIADRRGIAFSTLLSLVQRSIEDPPETGSLTDREITVLDQTDDLAGLNDDDRVSYLFGLTATTMAGVRDSLPTAQVARGLAVDESSVRHRKKRNLLFSISSAGSQRFPVWQFTTTDGGGLKPLPHLARVIAAVSDTDLHPADVADVMQNTHPELRIGGRDVSPREWLATGGAIRPVLDVIAAADNGW